jgi:hypothetical protein
MFCSFDKMPRIMRWFCTGRVIEWDKPEFEDLLKRMGKAKLDGARAIILLHVWKGKLHPANNESGGTDVDSANVVRLRRANDLLCNRSSEGERGTKGLFPGPADAGEFCAQDDREGGDGGVSAGVECAEFGWV